MAKFLRHLFVCTNERAPGDARGSCSARGSLEVAAALKEKVHACGLKRIVRVNKAGCLDQCARGVTLVVYPEGVWYGGVTTADVDELVERHLVRGERVTRLEIPDNELTGKEPPSGGPVVAKGEA
jgi:(2Fe-2S) ferredoxin